MKQEIVVCLGRYGDVMNALPLAYGIKQETGIIPKFVISEQFWSILNGVSYVHPIVWKVHYGDGLRSNFRKLQRHDAIICQIFQNPDQQRKTESFQKESWRVAGKIHDFGKHPLVFDRRDKRRELDLANKHIKPGVKNVGICSSGHSSPFNIDFSTISNGVKGCNFIDLSAIKADKLYDMLGILDRLDLLVTIDTSMLHLSKASCVRVVSIINDGWFGSIPPENSVAVSRYSEFSHDWLLSVINKEVQ